MVSIGQFDSILSGLTNIRFSNKKINLNQPNNPGFTNIQLRKFGFFTVNFIYYLVDYILRNYIYCKFELVLLIT